MVCNVPQVEQVSETSDGTDEEKRQLTVRLLLSLFTEIHCLHGSLTCVLILYFIHFFTFI